MAIVASHMSSMGSFFRTDFFCASSRRLTYLGPRGLLVHQPSMAERRETIPVALRPPLPPLRLEGGIFLEGGGLCFVDNSDKESAPSAFDCLDESLEFNIGGPESFGLGTYGVVRVGCNDVVD